MMASVRPRLLKTPAEPSPELRISAAAAQTRVVSLAGIRLGSWESARAFKGIVCDDISEFESYMPSHAVGLSQVRNPAIVMHDCPAEERNRRQRKLAHCRLGRGRGKGISALGVSLERVSTSKTANASSGRAWIS